MSPSECTCSDNISCKCFCLFNLPSWRQCCSQCGHHFHVPTLMSNLSKLTRPDLETAIQSQSLHSSVAVWCHAPSRGRSLCPRVTAKLFCSDSLHSVDIWNPTASMLPAQKGRLGGKQEIQPREKASALSEALWLFLPERKLLSMGAVNDLAASFIFCGHFRGFLFRWLCDSLKLAPDEIKPWGYQLLRIYLSDAIIVNIWCLSQYLQHGTLLGVARSFFSVDDVQTAYFTYSFHVFLMAVSFLAKKLPCPTIRITPPWRHAPPTQNPNYNYQRHKALQREREHSKAHSCWVQLWICCCLGLYSTVIPITN